MNIKQVNKKTYNLVNLLTVFFVFTILYLHHRVYISIYNSFADVTAFDIYLVRLSVGGFFFLSGYKLTKTKLADSFVEFWKNRFLRIYPIYFIALIFFTFIVYPSFSRGNLPNIYVFFLHALGLQTLFPALFGKHYTTLYFIGLLFLYYLLFSTTKKPIKQGR